MKRFFKNSIVQLLTAVLLGIVTGLFIDGKPLEAVISIKHLSGQIIFFLVPLIILGFIAPSIAHLRSNASKMLVFAFAIAYLSSIGASFFGAAVGYQVIPHLNIASDASALKALPENVLKIDMVFLQDFNGVLRITQTCHGETSFRSCFPASIPYF